MSRRQPVHVKPSHGCAKCPNIHPECRSRLKKMQKSKLTLAHQRSTRLEGLSKPNSPPTMKMQPLSASLIAAMRLFAPITGDLP
jgi:hypothetical protein